MVTKMLQRSTLREIGSTLNRFIAIFAIIALGTSFFAGLKATGPQMLDTANIYFTDYHLADARLVSDMGFTQENVDALKNSKLVESIEAGYFMDYLVSDNAETEDATTTAMRFHTLPDDLSDDNANYLNRLNLKSGRLPTNKDEVVVIKGQNNFNLGDEIVFSNNNESDSLKMIKNHTFTIVGFAESPSYITNIMGNTTIGSGSIGAVGYVLQDAFDSEYYTEINLVFNNTKNKDAYTDTYDDTVEQDLKELQTLVDAQEQQRYDDIMQEGQTKLSDAQNQLDDAKQQADEELSNAATQLDDGQREIDTNRNEWDKNNTLYQQNLNKISASEKEIASGQSQLNSAQTQLNQEKSNANAQLNAAKTQLDNAQAQIVAGQQQLAPQQQAYNQKNQEYLAAKSQQDAAKTQIQNGTKLVSSMQTLSAQLPAIQSSINTLEQQASNLEQSAKQLETQAAALEQSGDAEQAKQLRAQASAQRQQSQNASAAANKARSNVTATLRAQANALDSQGAQGAQGAGALRAQATAIENGAPVTNAQAPLNQISASLQAQLNSAQAQVNAAQPQLDAAATQLAQANTQLTAAQNQLSTANKQYQSGLAAYNSQRAKANITIQTAQNEINTNLATLNAAKQQITSGKSQLTTARAQLDDAANQLNSAQQTLDENREVYENKKVEVQQELSKNQDEIDTQKQKLDDLEPPVWILNNRDKNPGYSEFYDNANRISNIAKLFPLFFFLVAALVSLTTMTRMVEDQRIQIGTLKALGFRKTEIAYKYLVYAIVASLSGGIAGVLLGFWVFPTTIWTAYQTLYSMPSFTYHFWPSYAIISIVAALLSTTLATLWACYGELVSTPAQLMIPKAPPAGKRIFLEKIPFLWKHFNFNQKVTSRNLLRYKKRFFMTVIGVAGCTALVLTGFGLKDAIFGLVDDQFSIIQTYDTNIVLKDGASQKDNNNLNDLLSKDGEYLYSYSNAIQASANDKTISQSINITVPEDASQINDFIHFANRKTGESIDFPPGDNQVVITEKMGKVLGLDIGDEMTLSLEDQPDIQVTIAGLTENYVYNYVYMSPNTYKSFYNELPEYTSVMLKSNNTQVNSSEREKMLSTLVEQDNVISAVDMLQEKETFTDSLDSLNLVVWVILIAAGALAIVVIYNLTNINIVERTREIATLKVLGFYDKEAAGYIYKENILLTFIGSLFGLILGIFFHRFVLSSAELEFLMFKQEIKPISFVLAVLFTMLCTIIVDLMMYPKIKKLDMVESLKAVE